MAYVRKVRTGSGAVAVQMVRNVRGRREIIAHVGSVHTDAELGMLLEQARQLALGNQGMPALDVPEPVTLIDDVANRRTGQLPEASNKPPQFAAPGRTARTSSRLLYDVIGSAYDRLGFDIVGDPVFRDLVIARIVEPTSKVDALRVLDDLGTTPVSYKTIRRRLAQVTPDGYRDQVADKCFDYAAETGGLSLVLYDVTTLYLRQKRRTTSARSDSPRNAE